MQPGMAVVQIVPTDAVWITANFKETQLEKMRVGQPADIAGAVAYLCSNDADFVTGHILDVNGGFDI